MTFFYKGHSLFAKINAEVDSKIQYTIIIFVLHEVTFNYLVDFYRRCPTLRSIKAEAMITNKQIFSWLPLASVVNSRLDALHSMVHGVKLHILSVVKLKFN